MLLFFPLNLFTTSMISIGPSLRRKSFERPEPTLPRPTPIREPSSNGRTTYKDMKLPLEQLGDYSKRHLFTMGNLSTDKSLSRIHSDDQAMKQSRFDYDHHNTDSIAQLFEHKNESHLNSKKRSEPQPSEPQQSSEQKMSVEEESLVTQRAPEREEEEPEGREGENYDDYVLGDKVEQEEPDEKPERLTKKYAKAHSTNTLAPYLSASESELRLERQHILNERRRLAQINEDREIALILAQYKNNKQQMLAHCARKHEAARIVAALREPQQKVEKSASLPALKPKRELIVPEDYHEERPVEPWKNTKNLLAKSLEPREEGEGKGRFTLSFGKLGFGRKKTRTICEQDILEQEMGALEEIKRKLRAKGIPFDANRLKKGLLNQKHEPYEQLLCPDKRLPSNPIYKKFPL